MYDNFLSIINENYYGVINLKEALNNGISRNVLKSMMNQNLIQKIDYGLYATKDFIYDEFYLFQLKHPNIVFSYNTALYFWGMTERTPMKMDVTTSRNNSLNYCKDEVNLYRVNKDILELGKIQIKTMTGKIVNCYNLERTVCDIINNKKNIDIQTANKAIKSSIRSKEFNANLMFKYAKKLKIYDKVENYMEAII